MTRIPIVSYGVLLSVAIIFDGLFLGGVLRSDYFGDDLYNFQVHGAIPYYFNSIWEMNVHFFKQWINIGRFYPFAYYAYPLFFYLDNITFYKLFLLSITLLAVIIFSWVIYLFSKDKRLALLVLVVTPVFFQFRFYLDPFLSFHGLIQVVAIEIFLAIGLFKLFLEKDKSIYLFLSIMFWFFSLLTYEITYPFIIMFLWLATKSRMPVKVGVGYFLPLIFVICVVIWLRVNAQASSAAYIPDFDIWVILKTWFFQVLSVLPGSYYAVSPIPSLKLTGYYVLLAFVLFYLLYRLCSFKKVLESNNKKMLVYLSLILLTLPGFMISFSTRYQSQISFGFAYLPIFMQYFGLSTLVSIFIYQINNSILKITAIATMGGILIVHMSANDSVIEMVNAPYKNERHVLALFYSDAMIKGMVEKNSTVCFKNNNPLNTREFISLYMHKKVSVKTVENSACRFNVDYAVQSGQARIDLVDKKKGAHFVFSYMKDKKGEWQLEKQ